MSGHNVIAINTVEAFCDLLGFPAARHPLFAVYPLSAITDTSVIGQRVRLNLFTILAKDGTTCNATYGWRSYDFTKGAMNFYAPGQEHYWGEQEPEEIHWGWVIVFHPDFVRKYPLGGKLPALKFFSYEVSEALHISENEKATVSHLLEDLGREYGHDIDESTQGIIVSLLEVLLSYAQRFYTRQFRTRGSVEPDIAVRFREALEQHYSKNEPLLASVGGIAADLAMSPHYLSDYLRAETGRSARQHIQDYLIDKSKGLLLSSDLTATEIAYRLGFEYPQHFTRLFKSRTGMTPMQFRQAN